MSVTATVAREILDRDRIVVAVAVAVVVLLLAVFVLAPLYAILRTSFATPDGFGFANYARYFASPKFTRVVGNSFAVSLTTTAITLVLEVRRLMASLYRIVDATMLLSSAPVLAVAFTEWGAKATLGAMAVLLLLPIGAAMVVWVRSGASEEGWPE